MKLLLFAAFVALPAACANITACSSGCNYTTAQAALNASSNGDTLILTAGQNLGSLTIPGNRHDLTIKSSLIDTYPRGYRITRSSADLARLTTVTIGDFAGWGTTAPGGSTLTNSPGGTTQAHGLNVGDSVTVGGTYYSTYLCASINQPPYVDGACDSTRVGFMNIRGDTKLGNGSVLYFKGRTLPSPLLLNTPYYIVTFTRGGSPANPDKFQIAATLNGSPISIPQFNPFGQDLVVEVPPLPRQIGDTMYVVSTATSTTLQLSPTMGGMPTVWTQIPYGYNGGGFSSGISITKTSPVYNIVFDGIEVFPTSDAGVYYPFYVVAYIANSAGEHHDIKILRCWIHGADDQEDFPSAMVNVAARNLEIGWNVIENSYSTVTDSQNIAFMSTANVSIHDNELKGATEGIISGGNFPWFAFQTNTTGISVYRNYIWKPLKAYTGIVAVYVGPTQFQLLSRFVASVLGGSSSASDCSVTASDANMALHCFAYEAQETPGTATPPSAPAVSRTEWSASAANSMFTVTGTSGQAGYIYLLGGIFHMDYNYGGTVSCPSGIVCTFVSTPVFPVSSTRIGIALVGSNGTGDNFFDLATFYGENRNVWSKNLLESKYGDNWLIEGNVFHRQSNCDGGDSCQAPAIQFTIAVNGSGASDPVNYLVSSSQSIIRNNIFRMMSAGIVAQGKSFFGTTQGSVGNIWEFYGFGRSLANSVQNNLFMDLGSNEYQAYANGALAQLANTEAFTVTHNTGVDVRIGFLGNVGLGPNKSATFRSNVTAGYRSACPGWPGSCANPAATSEIGVQNPNGLPPIAYSGGDSSNNWTGAITQNDFDANSNFDNNLVMNRPAFGTFLTNRPVSYPNTTWLVEPTDTPNDPNTLFTTWNERDNSVAPNGLIYRAGNYRLATGQPALYPAYDSRTIGADIDEIEALTGRAGIDVENGNPMFSDRTARTISAGVISYTSNSSTCLITVWPNSSYSGAPTVNTTDSGIAPVNGRISVTLSGISSNTNYFGKRWCGSEVDVFMIPAIVIPPAAPPTLMLIGTNSPRHGARLRSGKADL